MKVKLAEGAVLDLLTHAQFIGVCAELIQIEHRNRLIDTRFSNPAINQHAKRVKESSQMIQTHLSSLTVVKGREFFSDEYCVQLHQALKHFIGLSVEQLTEFVDTIQEIKSNGGTIT